MLPIIARKRLRPVSREGTWGGVDGTVTALYLLKLIAKLTICTSTRSLAVMVIDAVCGLGIAVHVPHLLRLVVENINLPTEVTMRIETDGVRELVVQRVQGG